MTPEIIEKSGIVDRYLLRQLTPDELHAFELYLFENPDFLDEVKVQEAMIKGMKSDAALAGEKTPTSASGAGLGWFRSLTMPLFSAAAGAALTAAVIALFFVAGPESEEIRVVSDQPRLVLRQTRSGTTLPVEIEHSAISPGLLLAMELGPVGYSSVALQLRAADRPWSWREEVVPSGTTARIELLVPQILVSPGEYEVRVYPPGSDTSTAIAEFRFRVAP